jgi:hypothetical protein
MSWGLNIKNVFLPRVTKTELESKLEENNDLLSYYEKQLIAMAVYLRPNIINDEGEKINIIDYCTNRIPDILESYREKAEENRLIKEALKDIDEIEEA